MNRTQRFAALIVLVAAVGMLAVSSAGASTLLRERCSHWRYFDGGYERTHACVSLHRRAHRHIAGHAWTDIFYETTSPYPQWHEDHSRRVDLCAEFHFGDNSHTGPCVSAHGFVDLTFRPGRCRRGAEANLDGSGYVGYHNWVHRTIVDLSYTCTF